MTDEDSLNSEEFNVWQLGGAEELRLHQLAARQYWSAKRRTQTARDSEKSTSTAPVMAIPEHWNMLGEVQLYEWQHQCIAAWFDAGRRGTVKVVTGAGKTVLALGLIELLQHEQTDLHVAVVVPTIVLMNQWYDELVQRSNLPAVAIGRLGGGYGDDFTGERRILLCVLNSAQAKLASLVTAGNHGERLLLIVDECHRAGAPIMRQIFETPRRYSLGLSATPERNDARDEEESGDDSVEPTEVVSADVDYASSLLGQELGPIVYEMSLATAFQAGILPPYEIRHYGLPLTLTEKQRYEQLSRSIQDTRSDLLNYARADRSSEADFQRWCRSQVNRGGEIGALARRYISDIGRRKILLYRADARQQAVIVLLQQELAENPDARAILFHESIDEAMELWAALVKADLPAVPENSELTPSLRETSLDQFRRGVAQILVSVRSLIEGFNVPATDIGIVVASSTSARQRIQTLGRVLRKHRTRTGEDKHAVVHVLYMTDTVDEIIYAKTDWDRLTGAERNVYYKWVPNRDTEPIEQSEPPRRPLPADIEIDGASLRPGVEYPGRYDGTEYSADSSGNVYEAGDKARAVSNPQNVPEQLKQVKASYGRFRVTPNKRYVLVRVPRQDDWITLYVASLTEPFKIGTIASKSTVVNWSDLKPGDVVTGWTPDIDLELGYKKARGLRGVIVKKVKGGEVYARTLDRAQDSACGRQAEILLDALEAAEKKLGVRIPKFQITIDNIAVALRDGQWVFIAQLIDPLEFPDDARGG